MNYFGQRKALFTIPFMSGLSIKTIWLSVVVLCSLGVEEP